MGTLDDAIREHLDLKRRAGASADEVRRLESEALGPARRDAPAPDDAPPTAPLADTEPEPSAPEPAQAREPDRSPAPEPALEPDGAPEPVPAPREPEAFQPAAEAAERDAPAPPRDTGEDARGGWLEEDPFAGDDMAAAPASDLVPPDEEADDVLEETPDFLQQTPEHDRLWFEQKPPRDFDFDR